MELNILKPKEVSSIAKITIHKTGKMGFSKGASELLSIDKNKYAKFGINNKNELFIIMKSENDDETFSIAKAGDYYYISARTLLEDLGIDYTNGDTVIFDIRKTEEDSIYRLSKRVIKK